MQVRFTARRAAGLSVSDINSAVDSSFGIAELLLDWLKVRTQELILLAEQYCDLGDGAIPVIVLEGFLIHDRVAFLAIGNLVTLVLEHCRDLLRRPWVEAHTRAELAIIVTVTLNPGNCLLYTSPSPRDS